MQIKLSVKLFVTHIYLPIIVSIFCVCQYTYTPIQRITYRPSYFLPCPPTHPTLKLRILPSTHVHYANYKIPYIHVPACLIACPIHQLTTFLSSYSPTHLATHPHGFLSVSPPFYACAPKLSLFTTRRHNVFNTTTPSINLFIHVLTLPRILLSV